jgi:CRISPR-associated endonuclease/helicase Cas3
VEPHHLLLPAKFGESGGVYAVHPLICHMLDTAAVARAIWDDVLPPAQRRAIADALHVTDESARCWCAFLAGVHDLGKAAPAFLSHEPAKPLWPALPPALRPGPSLQPRDAPHGFVTTLALKELLPGVFGIEEGVTWRLAAISGGHHGILPSRSAVEALKVTATGNLPWRQARRALFDELAARLRLGDVEAPSALPNEAAVVLAGLISVADWIASDEHHFPYLVADLRTPPDLSALSAYADASQAQAQRALALLHWHAPPPIEGPRSFGELFAGRAPRDVQLRASALAEVLQTPSLVVIEAPTGEGKTEAALEIAYRSLVAGAARGLYVALPTQATSDQLYGRTRDFLSNAYPGDVVLLQLLHGHASLSAEFSESLQRGRQLRPTEVDIESGDGATIAGDWFTYRKRGLLAPFGVGTVDQALMAALQTKHVFVRLFGLAHKTVVIDEVHAYDTYMSELIERLLEWLGAMRSAVVLLSATLPAGRSLGMLEAYARGRGDAETPILELAPYPRISWTSPKAAGSVHADASETSSRTLRIEQIQSAEDAGSADALAPLIELLRRLLAQGGCAAVICNTVDRSQAVYRALRPHFSARADDGQAEIELLHARFPFDERHEREVRCHSRFGPEPERRPSRSVLVATQIIEQSLDVDFDVIITDFAPADLLLQRAGRLHRHARKQPRPPLLAEPVLHVWMPRVDSDGVPAFERGDAAVYEEHVLLRTWLALRGRNTVAIPGDVERLIEDVYSPGDAAPAGASDALARKWETTLGQLHKQRQHDEQEAHDRWVKPPYSRGDLHELTADPRDEDAPELHKAHQALTRLGDPSAQLICLSGASGAPTLPDGTPVDLATRPDAPMARRLLMRAVPVSKRGLVQALLALPQPPVWRTSPLLRHHRLLIFDEDSVCRLEPWTLRLDRDVGLEITRNDGGPQ